MMTNNKAGQLLRRTALSAAMLLIAAPAALADPPGYLFRDSNDTAPATVSAPMPPLQRDAAYQEAARPPSTRAGTLGQTGMNIPCPGREGYPDCHSYGGASWPAYSSNSMAGD